MKLFHIKSVILGIGIGIVLTSVISMIYMAGNNFGDSISKEYIKAEAKKLGMIENNGFVDNSVKTKSSEEVKESQKNQQNETVKAVETNKKPESPKPLDNVAQSQPKPEVQEITISVIPGDSSEKVAEKLFNAGLIKDRKVFITELSNAGLASEINIGQFKIRTGTDIRGIIKILTGKG